MVHEYVQTSSISCTGYILIIIIIIIIITYPVFFSNHNKARGAHSARLTRGSTRRGQRTYPAKYYEDGQ